MHEKRSTFRNAIVNLQIKTENPESFQERKKITNTGRKIKSRSDLSSATANTERKKGSLLRQNYFRSGILY